MIIEGKKVPEPNYDYNADRLVRYYSNALSSMQRELRKASLFSLQHAAQAYALQENIRNILHGLNQDAYQWANDNIPNAAYDGVASALVSLGLVKTLDEAKRIASFNQVNQKLVNQAVADTQQDVLAISQYIDKNVRNSIRNIAATVIRENLAQGYGRRTITDEMRKRVEKLQKDLEGAADVAIRDNANRVWKAETYTHMLARTKLMNVYNDSTTNEAVGRGANYGIISTNPRTRDACIYHEGRVILLDSNAQGDFMTLEELKGTGQIFHPNCKHHVLPFSRFDRLNPAALEQAKRQETAGRAAMEAGGRNPDAAKVAQFKATHKDAFQVPQQPKPVPQAQPVPQQPKPKAAPKPKETRGHITDVHYERSSSDRAKVIEIVAKDIQAGLKKAERVVESVRQWSGSYYGDIRRIQNKTLDPSYNETAAGFAKDIDEFIRKAPIWGEHGTTYRGIGVSYDVAADILKKLSKKNGKVDMMGAASWSSAERVAHNFAGGRGDVKMIFINKGATKKGTSIMHVSKFRTEDEILVSKTAKYKAVDIVKFSDRHYEIEVEEV
jgi:hypothetical protein